MVSLVSSFLKFLPCWVEAPGWILLAWYIVVTGSVPSGRGGWGREFWEETRGWARGDFSFPARVKTLEDS